MTRLLRSSVDVYFVLVNMRIIQKTLQYILYDPEKNVPFIQILLFPMF